MFDQKLTEWANLSYANCICNLYCKSKTEDRKSNKYLEYTYMEKTRLKKMFSIYVVIYL